METYHLQDALTRMLLPACVGALVGYVTNVAAVRLLFYPEKPVGLWRIRIQGLIPARKAEIASRLVEVVSRYVTREDVEYVIRGALEKGVLRDYVEAKVYEYLSSMRAARYLSALSRGALDQVLMGLAAALADSLETVFRDVGAELAREVASKVEFKDVVERKVRSLTSREIEEVFRRFAGRELRVIELSGLLLGGIIGLVQGVVHYLLLPPP